MRRLQLFILLIVGLFLFPYLFYGTDKLLVVVLQNLFLIPIVLFSLAFHEFAHAAMADFLGDPTPRRQGRLSLNPLRHLDLVGTLMLFFARFGWAKPVQVDASNFKRPHRAMLSVALAGPFSNIFLAWVGALTMRVALFFRVVSLGPPDITLSFTSILLGRALVSFIWLNLGLAIFNLLPLPPLDGSRVVAYFLPARYRLQYRQFELMAPMILLLLFMFGFLQQILAPLVGTSMTLLLRLTGLSGM